jgi:glutathione reductase (NADPH)
VSGSRCLGDKHLTCARESGVRCVMGTDPTVAFTIPSLASVGMSEQTAREKGLKFRTHREIASSWYSSRRVAEDCSGFKVLIEDDTDRILGAHLLGPHAEEVINLFAFAIATNAGAADLRDAIFAYPTLSSDVRYML